MLKDCVRKAAIIHLMRKEMPGISKEEMAEIYDSIVERIIAGILAGDRIEIRGFGILYTQAFKGYQGRNPRNGQDVKVPPKRKLRFKVGQDLIEKVDRMSRFYIKEEVI